jgi:hypothetical protein
MAMGSRNSKRRRRAHEPPQAFLLQARQALTPSNGGGFGRFHFQRCYGLHRIDRADSRDPSIDIDKLDRLLRERENARLAEQAFCAALADAQTEMQPVVADCTNPSTGNSRYASYAALDRAVRPIYTRHGFGLSFNTDEAPGLEQARILCDVCHSGGHSRRYRIDMPVDGKGARGGDVMTRTHAMGSGVSYGMRYLLRMIFNLAVDSDDDGNAAGYRTRGYDQRREVVPHRARSEEPRSTGAHDTGPAGATRADHAGISDRAIAARAERAWEGQRTQPFHAGEAGKREVTVDNVHGDVADPEIEARRAAVQLQRSFEKPAYVVEPPQRKLQRDLDKQRHAGAAYEAKLRSERVDNGKFHQPLKPQPQYTEINPPPEVSDSIPPFLDRRRR